MGWVRQNLRRDNFLLLMGAYLFALPVLALSEPVWELPEIEVTAERPKEALKPGDVDLSQHTGFTSTVDHDQFDAHVTDLGGVLKTMTSTQIRQLGGVGSYSRVLVRGASSNQVSVYWDDMLLNDAASPSVDLSIIPLAGVDSIRVYRGIVPLNFGLNAPGGVVHIKTRRAVDEPQRSLSASYGAFGTRDLSAYLDNRHEKLSYTLTGEYLSSDNNYPTLNINSTPFNSQDDYIDPRHNAQFHRYSVLTKATYDVSSNSQLQVMAIGNHKLEGIPNLNNSPSANATLALDDQRAEFVLYQDFINSHSISLKTYAGLAKKRLEYEDVNQTIGLKAQHNIYQTRTWHLEAFAERYGPTHTLSGHAMIRAEAFDEQNLIKLETQPKRNRLYFSGSIQDHIAFAQGAGSLLLAARSYRLADSVSGEQGNSTSIWRHTPQIGVEYHLSREWALKVSAAGYFREPTFYELYGSQGYSSGNKDLKAEHARNYDIGFTAQGSPGKPWLKTWNWEAAAFANPITNGIANIYDSRGVGHAINVSRTRNRGVETDVKFELGEIVSASMSATWQLPINIDESNIESKTLILPGRFPFSYKSRIETEHLSNRTFLEILVEDGMYYDSLNLLPAPQRRLINVGYSRQFGKVSANIELKNVTNQRYSDFSLQPQPGISWYLTLQYQFAKDCRTGCDK